MNVFAVSQVAMVDAEGYDDPMALDLVAHLIGIVPHHNENRDPRRKTNIAPKTKRSEVFLVTTSE